MPEPAPVPGRGKIGGLPWYAWAAAAVLGLAVGLYLTRGGKAAAGVIEDEGAAAGGRGLGAEAEPPVGIALPPDLLTALGLRPSLGAPLGVEGGDISAPSSFVSNGDGAITPTPTTTPVSGWPPGGPPPTRFDWPTFPGPTPFVPTPGYVSPALVPLSPERFGGPRFSE